MWIGRKRWMHLVERLEDLEITADRLSREVKKLKRHDKPCNAKFDYSANGLADCQECGWTVAEHESRAAARD